MVCGKDQKMRNLVTALVIVTMMMTFVTGIGFTRAGINIQGSDTMLGIGQALAEEFLEETGKFPSVSGGGSGIGINALINGTIDIAQASRAMRPSEFDAARANGIDVYEIVLAQDGLAMVVNQANPIDQLSLGQLKQILVGEVTHWSQLGWEEGGRIIIYSRQETSGTHVYVRENIMDRQDWAPGTRFLPGSSAINEAVKADVFGLGYYGVGYVDGVKALKVSWSDEGPGFSPLVKKNIDEGLYPIARPLFLYVAGNPQGTVLEYLRFCLGDKGQEILAGIGFYSPIPEQIEANNNVFSSLGITF